MPWHSSYDTYSPPGEYGDGDPEFNTSHHTYRAPGSAAANHELYVAHAPESGEATVRLGHTDGTGLRHFVTLKRAGSGSWHVRQTRSNGLPVLPRPVAPPSPTLETLIEHHHEGDNWMPLLDKLAEEYPEHFDEAVRHHTAARTLP